MSQFTASAAGGAMPAEDLEHVADAIHQARNLMADAAALYAEAEAKLASARAALAIPAPVDPIFATIERHKSAWAAFTDTVAPLENVEGGQQGTKEELAYNQAR